MDYNYSNNHEDNFQDESAEVIGYCEICDCEIKATDKYYHFYDYDMICPKCAKLSSVAKCEKCNTYFKIGDLTKYEYNSEIHYFSTSINQKTKPQQIILIKLFHLNKFKLQNTYLINTA